MEPAQDEGHQEEAHNEQSSDVKNTHDNGSDNHQNHDKESSTPPTCPPPWYILPTIVVSQLAGTSLWFAGNAVLEDMIDDWQQRQSSTTSNYIITESSRGYLTSVVQLGFIVGTLISAITNLVDRFRPTQLFGLAASMGTIFNAVIPIWWKLSGPEWMVLAGLIMLRFMTGVMLAGIYPVGMKVAADWFPPGGLGRALGFLVGALAVGSATPFLLNSIPQSWQALLWETSALALLGGIAVACFVPEGPYRKPQIQKMDPSIIYTLFNDCAFRGAAFGYVGHMWELYAFWTWCPVVWEAYIDRNSDQIAHWDASAITFGILAIGGVGCVLGGIASFRYGSAIVAFVTLAISGVLCLVSPTLFLWAPPILMLIAYMLWGLTVVADSPQFSSLIATTAPASNKGTALTIVNCLGFTITIGSIQLLAVPIPEQYLFLLLAPGPAFGLWSMRRNAFTSFQPPPTQPAGQIETSFGDKIQANDRETGEIASLDLGMQVQQE